MSWDPQALKVYRRLRSRLPPLKRDLLDDQINRLREFPPSKWYELRHQGDGTITFQLESNQFARILGRFEDGTVFITHVELRTK